MDRRRLCLFCRHKSMTNLMIRNNQLFLIGKHTVFLLISGNDNLNTLLKICLSGKLTSVPDSTKSRLIDNVCKLCAGSAGSSLCDLVKTDRICNFNLFRMNLKNLFSSLKIRKLHRDSSVKTPRTEKSRVKRIRSVGCSQNHHTFRTVKAIHLCEKLVKSLLTLIISARKTCTVTFFTNGINLIDKYNTGSLFIGLLK